MTLQNWITLAVAIIGVLHGPATTSIINALGKNKTTK